VWLDSNVLITKFKSGHKLRTYSDKASSRMNILSPIFDSNLACMFFSIALRMTLITLLYRIVISVIFPTHPFSICANVEWRSLLSRWQFVLRWLYLFWMFADVGRTSGLAATVNQKNASDFIVLTWVSILFDTRLACSIAKVAPCCSFLSKISIFYDCTTFSISSSR
jgi:hypothetical protein